MFSIFSSRESVTCFSLILIQQIIVAFSTIFIGELAKTIASDHISWVYFYLFIFSLIVVYIPATLSRIYLEKVRYIAQHKYINQFVDAHRGQIHLSSKEEERKLPFITSEGQATIDATAFFLFEVVSITLNVIASLIALSYIIDPILILSYGFSFILLSAYIFLTHNRIAYSSKEAQEARAQSLSRLLNSWENITINNNYNYTIWREGFEKAFKKARDKNVRNQWVKQIVSSSGMLLSLVPLLGTLTYLLYTALTNFPLQALIVATLPRQIQMIQNMDIVVQYFSEWTDLKQRLEGLKTALRIPFDAPEKRIQWEKIHFSSSANPLNISTFNSLRQIMGEPNRITIRGENGTGKSTLLKCLKEKLGGYYLPAKPNLNFASKDWQHLSTGEQILTALKEVCEGENLEKLILLDEWDANLDRINREKLSRVIDQIATKATVVEVIHRQD